MFFSIASIYSFLSLKKQTKTLEFLREKNDGDFLVLLEKLLKTSGLCLRDIEKVFFSSGPGSQAKIRTTLLFVVTLKALNSKIQFFHVNTLLLQAGKKKCISILGLDKRGNKFHVGIFQDGKQIKKHQILLKEEVKQLANNFSDFILLKDTEQTDFLVNFEELIDFFICFKDDNKIIKKYL